MITIRMVHVLCHQRSSANFPYKQNCNSIPEALVALDWLGQAPRAFLFAAVLSSFRGAWPFDRLMPGKLWNNTVCLE